MLHGGIANEQHGENCLESFLADLVGPHDTANNIASSSAMPKRRKTVKQGVRQSSKA